ncbi:putative ribosomal protein s17 [Lyophyllum shimeji]|uniref:Ribosomal protein s17 n=1 Tax=Lyophyllum shimeji TaxID=47721 RepID=A0A9P3UR20_LYOSH|nr:putative ribosomal protein s17 [Lyophyllum shimeji]
MHSKSLLVAFLTLALSAFTAQGAPAPQQDRFGNHCAPPQVRTVVSTVTVTARATATAKPGNNTNTNNGGNNQGNNNNNQGNNGNNGNGNTSNNGGKGNTGNNNGTGGGKNTTTKAATSTKAATTTAATTTRANNNGGGVKGTATSTSSAAQATNTGKGNNGGNNANTGDPQTSLTLDPRVIAKGFANDGQDVPAEGQVRSLTSTNNFINFCLTVPNLPITDGKQITTGSCNPAPIGTIPSIDNMPSSKFSFPQNFGTIKANTPFTIEMNIRGMQTGFFVNAQENYFAAPQQLNAQGQIQGHSHVVVEQLTSLDQATPTDPKKFAFFKGLNAAAVNGKLTADVTSGLPAGFYKLSSINTSSNHAPVIVPVAQHGSLDDAIYFTVTADGKPLPGSTGAAPPAASSAAASSVAASSTVKGGATASASASSVATSAAATASASEVAATGKATATGKGAATATGKDAATATGKDAATATGKGAATATGKDAATATGKGAATATGKATTPAATGKGAQAASSQAAAATSAKAPVATGKPVPAEVAPGAGGKGNAQNSRN